MSRIKVLQAIVWFTLVTSFVVGCSIPTDTPEPKSTSELVSQTSTPASTPTSALTPTLELQARVILAFHEAFTNNDIDALMALVADDAVLDLGPRGVVTGKEKIRTAVLLEMQDNLIHKASRFVVEGNKVTYYFEVFVGARCVDQGFSVAIIENGKIISDLPVK
jgi:ketosteroid isomerase-like protein